MHLFKLSNEVQNYSWGSKTSLRDLFGVPNPQLHHQAELWMGAHPNCCSKVCPSGELLSDIIACNPEEVLGEQTFSRFGELPFLFKVLAAEAPLSIQVHPKKEMSELGFERESNLGLSLNDPKRNYKDPNHKPELVYAISPYKAMNGFRPINAIVSLFEELPVRCLTKHVQRLAANPVETQLKEFFSRVITLSSTTKELALKQLLLATKQEHLSPLALEVIDYIEQFNRFYPNDIGLFAPLMLNTIELQPGEAMFLYAETPHAYVCGTAVEIMANSDNVLRAGLTAKHIDVEELINNTNFQSIAPQELRMRPDIKGQKLVYPVPVEDFSFDIIHVVQALEQQILKSAEILFCLEGRVTIQSNEEQMSLVKGESMFISCGAKEYSYEGSGVLARTYN